MTEMSSWITVAKKVGSLLVDRLLDRVDVEGHVRSKRL